VTTVKLASALPKADENNGLVTIVDALLSEPTTMHVAVVVLDCSKITTDVDTGDAIPTARVLRAEVISDPEAKKRLGQYARRAFESRTGKTVLPLDLEDEIAAAFGTDGTD
jgi:hypothetical protein